VLVAASNEPNVTAAAVSKKATAKLGTDAPTWYDGAGRWPIQRLQKPRSAGWYSHS
jgi:hypothetical protein